jgi:hypothetical protein
VHRALATVAVFKLFLSLVVFSTTSTIDAVLLVSVLLMAISALIIRIVEEAEVAFILVGLILLIDVIGLLLSFTLLSPKVVLAYAFLVVWDIQLLMLLRQILRV